MQYGPRSCPVPGKMSPLYELASDGWLPQRPAHPRWVGGEGAGGRRVGQRDSSPSCNEPDVPVNHSSAPRVWGKVRAAALCRTSSVICETTWSPSGAGDLAMAGSVLEE